jgi:hypothetical protein
MILLGDPGAIRIDAGESMDRAGARLYDARHTRGDAGRAP